ncbi:embryonic polarity protein dorsal isoform X3 [Nilaparvata lugens]|uniref:embryonic polarity protein dorsal isoform X3 n=1 Tax=Nilaparvata lugens TaxID=108931 RepID=UPI00193DB5FB|nr:embryonic polarity protein dorsal isoform X3 [Nilaparvata lugens]
MEPDLESDGLPSIHISDVIEVIKQDEASGVRDFSAELRETEEVLAEDLATTGVLGATSGGFGIPAPTGTAISSGFFGTDSGWQLEVSSVVAGSSGLAGPSGVVASSGTSEFPGTGSGANVSSGPSGFPGAVSGANPSSGPSGFPGAGSGTNVSSGPSGFLGAVSNSGFAGPSESGPLLLGARGGGVVEGGTAIMHKQAVCVITEQPASKALRFRYECEGRSAGSIPGVNSTPENKTHPTIQIKNYVGRAVVVVSCVTKDSPYRPHPHSLVGKEGCKHGVCTMEVNTETMALAFANLGIQCIKKKDIEAALSQREKLRIDPFKTGYDHRNQPGSIDLNAVRLCFQVFLEGKIKNQFNVAITPVVSEPIYDKKAMSDLLICKLSEDSAPVTGGKQIILLCEKVAKEDISVKLYEVVNNQIVWEGECEFNTTDVHKQVAITFKTPRYKNIEVTEPIVAQIQLVRPSDKAASDPLPFQLTPIHSAPSIGVRRKRAKYNTIQELEAKNTNLLQCEGTLVKQELEREAFWKTSPVYGTPSPVYGAPSPAAAAGASPDYANLAAAVMQPSPAYGGPVYAPPPTFSPVGSVASPPEHQASVSPLPQMGHPMEQMNNLSMIQQQVNMDNNNLNMCQPQHSPMQHNIVQQHSPMQHNIMPQHSPLQHNIVDNMMQQQQHSPLQHNIVDNMAQQQQQIVDNMAQQQIVGNMAQHQQHVVMDMDTQQHSIELSAGRLDSRDLRDLDLDSVSENLSANLILNEIAGNNEQVMTSLEARLPSNSLLYYNQNNNSNGSNFPPTGGTSNML